MKPIHIEGMGLTGCLLAHTLARYGVGFTWNDTDAPHTAWKASTGAIYPASSLKFGDDDANYKVWAAWHDCGYFKGWHLEKCNYVFKTKAPPHGGKYSTERSSHDLGLAGVPSYHFNGQLFVEETRVRFADRRLLGVPQLHPNTMKIIAHGWGERLAYTYWGWTRLVQLEYADEYGASGQRPAFYFRPNKFVMTYAYPVPGTQWWYAGSSIIKQKLGSEKSLGMVSKYDKWEGQFTGLANGACKVVAVGAYKEGWRPAAAPDDTAWLRKRGNVLTMRPLWNSGIRHFPQQWAAIAAQLGLIA